MLTFLVSGLWHGNGIHYIVWGGWHGILRVLCHSKQSTNKQHARIWNIVNSMFTFLGVMFGFVFFRASSLEISFIYIKRMFSNLSFSLSDIIESILPFTMDYTCVAYFIVICFFNKHIRKFRYCNNYILYFVFKIYPTISIVCFL